MKKAIVGLILLLTLIISVISVSAAANGNLIAAKNNREITEEQKAELKAEVPESYEKVEKEIAKAVPVPRIFLMYTYDGKNIMWGTYGGGYFIGQDNLGKKAWGIYHGGIFAGFYDGDDFFVGKYSRGVWKAENLFDKKFSSGRYILFPLISPTAVTAEPIN